MSSRRRLEQCRICGGALQGNHRRWLFSGNKKNHTQTPTGSGRSHTQTPTGSGRSHTQTPTGSGRSHNQNQSRNQSQNQSNGSSPWGSTLSLGSSVSLTKSHLSSNASKNFELLSVLTHILGRPVGRGPGRGEFICGKCVSVLERVFKYDTVIARVRVLSSERLQRLMQERDKIRQWVRSSYTQKNPEDAPEDDPEDAPSRGSTSDDEAEKDGYRQMLRDNMALSQYECWSDRWDTCPYFIRTGKRCRKGYGCEGCDALRVSDSDYESVCGVPRHLPFTCSTLSRDKSRSMPLHSESWSESCSSPASLAGSTLSLPSRTESVQSLDSLDGHQAFPAPTNPPVNLLLKELALIQAKTLHSPPGSRIPVLDRSPGRGDRSQGRGDRSTGDRSIGLDIIEFLDFESGHDEDLDEEFLPLHRLSGQRPLQVIQQLSASLDQTQAETQTLTQSPQKLLEHGPEEDGHNGDASQDHSLLQDLQHCGAPLEALGLSLHSRERLLQECMLLIQRLCDEEGKGAELSEQLSESLKEAESQTRVALEKLQCEVFEEKQILEDELQSLKKTSIDREKDLDMLQTVLQSSQDLIQELRVCQEQQEQQLEALSSEREVLTQRETALTAALSDRDSLLTHLTQELQALSDSVLSDGSPEDRNLALVLRLKDRESDVSAMMQQLENSATLCQEVTKLTSALQHFQTLVQTLQQSHSRSLTSLNSDLSEARSRLRERELDLKHLTRGQRQERARSENLNRSLQQRLASRDLLIQQILDDAEQQQQLFRELQHKLCPPL